MGCSDKRRSYGEACRFAHALDLVGERWSLLIVRELLLGPKRYTDLRHGLPQASTNILAERLRGLEENGVVRKRKLPPPSPATVYELTEWGEELEPIVTHLGTWGARSPFPPETQEINSDSIVLAMRSLFDPDAADGAGVSVELRLDGEEFHAVITATAEPELEIGRGPVDNPDAVLTGSACGFAAVLSGELPLDAAVTAGEVEVVAGRRALGRFLKLFPMPELATA